MKSINELMGESDSLGLGKEYPQAEHKIIECPTCGQRYAAPGYEVDHVCQTSGCATRSQSRMDEDSWNFRHKDTLKTVEKNVYFESEPI